MAVTASKHRTFTYTEVHTCSGCRRAFWAKRGWNAVTVTCPHCGRGN